MRICNAYGSSTPDFWLMWKDFDYMPYEREMGDYLFVVFHFCVSFACLVLFCALVKMYLRLISGYMCKGLLWWGLEDQMECQVLNLDHLYIKHTIYPLTAPMRDHCFCLTFFPKHFY